jgi:putative ABC transport system substrate-binding protein
MAVLWSRALPEAGLMLEAARAAAAARGLSLIEWEYQVEDLGTAFAQAKSAGAEGVVFLTSNAAFGRRKEIADLALVHQLPSMHSFFVEVADGALMSYGVELGAIYRRTAALIDRILKGAKPADLPVEQPTNFTLAINLTTAAALGIELPSTLLARADEVVE